MIFALFQRDQDCWRAALATLLGLPLDGLPATIDGPSCRERGVSQLAETRRVLRPLGLDLVRAKPGQTIIRPAGDERDGELVVAGVLVEGHAHALVAVDVDGVFRSLWDPACGDPEDEYELVDVSRLVPWPRPSAVVAALVEAVRAAS